MPACLLQREWGTAVALCWLAACGARPPEPGAQVIESAGSVEPAPSAERAELERSVRAIESAAGLPMPALLSSEELVQVLGYYCGECHFPAAERSNIDGVFYMNDLEQLIEAGKVIPGDGDGSRLVRRIRAGEMPPENSGAPPVPAATTTRIAQYIDSLPRLPLAEPSPPAPPPPPWIGETRPNVPPVAAACFTYLGDWIRCEHEGSDALRIDIPGGELEACLQACRERADCVAVTDYTWLAQPELGCYLYLSSCSAPGPGPWHEEDGGRQYLKNCR